MKARKRKFPSKSKRAQAFLESNPATSVNEIAYRFTMTKPSVYALRNKMRKTGFNFPKRADQLASLAPAAPILTEQQQMIADKLRIDPVQYLQAVEGLDMMRKQLGDKAPKRFLLTRREVDFANKLGIPLDKFAEEWEKQQQDAAGSAPLEIEMFDFPDEVDATFDARAVEYGKFIEGAEVMQMLKRVVQAALNNRDKTLAHDQAEAMDMIIHKIGRIVNGNPDVVDHWLDIAGYAKLVADRLEGRVR
jgi:phage repressor protein C with HTH and peptisase S24 domain